MSPGKIASQVGHAFLDAFLKCQDIDPERACLYQGGGHGIKVTLKAKNLNALQRAQCEAEVAGIPHALITDLGYTCFDGQATITALGIGPIRKSEINNIVKRFSLLA